MLEYQAAVNRLNQMFGLMGSVANQQAATAQGVINNIRG